MPPGEARRAICRTSAIAAVAPAKAAMGSVQGTAKPMPVTVTATAPTAAPPETPNTYGSASGLRRSAWKVQPLIPSAPPTSAARAARGRRS